MEKYVMEQIAILQGKKRNASEEKRLAKVLEIISNENDCGRWGKAFEILNAKETSHKKGVAKQGRVDNYFTFNGKATPFESKTNGGRIGNLYKTKMQFIVYKMAFDTRTYTKKDGTQGGGKHYETDSVIMKISDFLQLLEECNAIKVIGHKDLEDSEPAIQGDSVKLYKRLIEYPIIFDRNATYTSDDFEDLEI